jgi:hypothetical protein
MTRSASPYDEDSEDGRGVDRVKQRALNVYQRRILYLCICGYNYRQVGDLLGVSARAVRRQVYEINHSVLPGIGNPHGESRMSRLAYTIGLLDAGVHPEDVSTFISRLEQRAIPYTQAEQVTRTGATGDASEYADE